MLGYTMRMYAWNVNCYTRGRITSAVNAINSVLDIFSSCYTVISAISHTYVVQLTMSAIC